MYTLFTYITAFRSNPVRKPDRKTGILFNNALIQINKSLLADFHQHTNTINRKTRENHQENEVLAFIRRCLHWLCYNSCTRRRCTFGGASTPNDASENVAARRLLVTPANFTRAVVLIGYAKFTARAIREIFTPKFLMRTIC